MIPIKILKKFFSAASYAGKGKSEVDKEKSELKGRIAERTKLRREKIVEIKREEKNIRSSAFQYYFDKYQNPSNMYKKLRETEGTKNEAQVHLIKEILNEVKRYNKSAEIKSM